MTKRNTAVINKMRKESNYLMAVKSVSTVNPLTGEVSENAVAHYTVWTVAEGRSFVHVLKENAPATKVHYRLIPMIAVEFEIGYSLELLDYSTELQRWSNRRCELVWKLGSPKAKLIRLLDRLYCRYRSFLCKHFDVMPF